MDTDFDSQAYSGSPAQLSNRDDHPIWEGQGDYPMVDVFDIQPEVDSDPQPEDRGISGFLDPLDSPLDYRFGASHMVILDNLPAEIPHYLSQEVDNILTVLLDSARDPIYGNEVSQSTRYWEFMGSPQSTHPEQSSGVCPRPTSLPSRPNLTSRPNNHAVMVAYRKFRDKRAISSPRGY
ncbi:hypothetical protein BDM02DRAFT_487408 [Thelephora ganbajun]|uniref:Uncharacterized protein n=1 Tax=Thelephora ganbajun TaxID=370292 RepID=A0ACB6Z8P3_THEGA|nr:hypothetical protein BDM02DRAFT_487408 [Thelephora ganbajun]